MDSELPRVSVLIPSYNHRRYIEQCIRSVLEQTWPNIELIVIDDGSTDGSPEFIAALAKEHRFRFEAQANQGVGATLNRAKALATGKYVSVCGSDDYLHPRKTEVLVKFLEANPEYALVHSNMVQVDEGSHETLRTRQRCKSGHVFSELLLGEFRINGLTALVRGDVYAQFSYGSFYIEDLYMWLQIAEKYPIGFVDEFLAYYRRHGNQATGNLLQMEAAEKQILDCFSGNSLYQGAVDRWRKTWFNHYAGLRRGDSAKAFERGVALLREGRLGLGGIARVMMLMALSQVAGITKRLASRAGPAR